MRQSLIDLCDALRTTGPTRWDITAPIGLGMPDVLSMWLNVVSTERRVLGLLVCPAAVMHAWWKAGWKGPTITSVGFLNELPDTADRMGVAVFSQQADYSAKFLLRLDEFLQGHADRCVLWRLHRDNEELNALLRKHRFVALDIT